MKIVTKLLHDKENPFLQFLKYSVCGCLSLSVDMLLFFLLAWIIFPVFMGSTASMSPGVKTFVFVVSSIIAFLVSNFVAYLTNVMFVFKGGKHSRTKEILLFYAVSAISVGLGIFIGAILTYMLGAGQVMPLIEKTIPYGAKVVSTVLINYAVRKHFIFNG